MRFQIHTVVITEGAAVFLENQRPTFLKYMLFVIFWVECGGSRFLPNVVIYRPGYMETIKTVNFMLCNLSIICTHAIYKETNNTKHTQVILSPQTTCLQVYRKNPRCHKKTSTQKE